VTTTAQICPLCNDTGWKEIGDGRERRVTRCDCQRRDYLQKLLERARIPDRYAHCELSNYDVLPGQFERVQSLALIAAKGFADNYPTEDRNGLLFVGSIGVGKTHLSVGILKELIQTKSVAGLFYDYRELLKEIQNSYNSSVATTEMQVLRPVFEAEVLVLDELGAVKPTEWVWDTVSHILNTRYNDKRTTVFTTNFPDQPPSGSSDDSERSRAFRATREETLGDRIGERMRSRLHEMCRVVNIQGEDFRTKFRSASLR